MSESNKQVSTGDLSFFSILTLIFITLKLTHVIAWSWWWILSPIWIPAALVLLVCGIVGLGYAIFG